MTECEEKTGRSGTLLQTESTDDSLTASITDLMLQISLNLSCYPHLLVLQESCWIAFIQGQKHLL